MLISKKVYVDVCRSPSQLGYATAMHVDSQGGVSLWKRVVRRALWRRMAPLRQVHERRTAWDRNVFKQIERVTTGLSSQRSGDRGFVGVLRDGTQRGHTPSPLNSTTCERVGSCRDIVVIFLEFLTGFYRRRTDDRISSSRECEGLSEGTRTDLQSAVGECQGGCSVHGAFTPYAVHHGQPTPRAVCEAGSVDQV